MPSPVRSILLVDDDEDDAVIVRDLLAGSARTRFELEWAPSFALGLEAIVQDRHDAYLVDYHLGERDGSELLREAVRLGVRGPVIMLTGVDSVATDEAVERMGASDYLIKGRTDAMLLERSIRYAIGRRQAELRQRFLSEASRVLSGSLELEETLRAAARVGVPLLGDFCLVFYSDPEHGGSRLVGAHADPDQARLLEVVERTYRPDPDNPHGVIRGVRRSGASVRTDLVPEEPLVVLAQSPEQLDAFRRLGGRADMAVSLFARGQTRGALVYSRTAPGAVFTDAEQELAEELARRVALTIDNAALYQRAREATKLRDEVLAVVSHDLRNPVGTVMLSAGFVLDHLPAVSLDETVRQQVGVMRRAALRMRRLIDDLLDVSRIEAGQLSLRLQPTPAAAVLTEFCEGFQSLVESAQQRLACDLPTELPLLAADRERLIQVLGNLVGNAIKFAPAETPIVLAARREDDAVRFSVSDSGPGIAAEDLPHLFERFWQKQKGNRSGAGLGLAIAKAIVEGHGGRIWVESREGAGTTIHFTIPAARPDRSAGRAESNADAPPVRAPSVRRGDVGAAPAPP